MLKRQNSNMDTLNYFGYGSNNWEQLCKRIGHVIPKPHPAILKNSRLVFQGSSDNWNGSSSANIVNDEGSQVRGSLYVLTIDEFTKLKEFEPRYIPKEVKVYDLKKGESVNAVIFYNQNKEPIRQPSREYLEACKRNLREVGFEVTDQL
jgi:hypothetical protein